MKKIIGCAFLVLASMLVLPLGVMKESEPAFAPAMALGVTDENNSYQSKSFRVLDCETNTVTEMPANDYVFGVLAAEMPALYDKEALKAQAVAAYTFACYRQRENTDKNYDITTDFTLDQSFISEEKAREKWGDKADEYCTKLKNAVEETENNAVTYDGKPILAVYHAISSGVTEDCKNVWGGDYPYLRAVASPGDTLAPEYISKAVFSLDEIKNKLSERCKLSGEASDYFKNIERTPSNTVTCIEVCGTALSGAEIRSVFSLRSSNFEVSYKEGSFTFTVYGYGHGVGMSQYGADYMAKQGSDFKEILLHYYSGCRIEKLS